MSDDIYDPFAEVGDGTPGVSWKDGDDENIPTPATYVLKISENLKPPSQSSNIDGDKEFWPDGNEKKEIIVKGEAITVPKGAERLEGKIIGHHVRIPSLALKRLKAETTEKSNPIRKGGTLTITLTERKKAKPDDKYKTNFIEYTYAAGDPLADVDAGAKSETASKADNPWGTSAKSNDDPPF